MQRQKPKLGQNFLVDDTARYRIADALGDVRERTVIEIGPGHGAITTILADRAKRLVCIELDRALAAELRFRFRSYGNVHIVEGDVLQTRLASFVSDGEKAMVIGNLPYYITSSILLHLFAHAEALEEAVVMMQREVADRVAATPGTRDFGLLSATAQMHAKVRNLFTLPPDAFRPPPEVWSSVLQLQFEPRFSELGISDPAAFDRFLKTCFQQKRKTLLSNLRSTGLSSDVVVAACEVCRIEPSVRAEAMPLEMFAALFRALKLELA